MEQTADEIKRLRACINELISVLALPALWSGHEPSQVVSTLLDVLLGMLRLDFAYVRLSDSIGGGAPIGMVRSAQRRNLTAQPQEIGQILNPWLTGEPYTSPLVVPNPIGEGEVSIAPLRLGLQDEVGVLVAGSRRADFPTEVERLLLRVAANQAAIALQEARLMSEQRRAAEEIRFQAGLLDAVDQAVVATDMKGLITYWNRFAEQLYGWSASEVIAHNILDITPAQGSQSVGAEILSRLQRGERWSGECLVQHRNGTIFPVLVTDSPIYNNREVLIGIVRVSIDITERKRAEEELEQRVVERTRQLTAVNEELRKEIIERKRADEVLHKTQVELAHVTRVMTLGELTASIAHEVNQPLSGVVLNGNACLRWLGGDAPNLDEAREAARRIVRDGKRASDVLTRIRALVRKTDPEKARLDLNDAIQEVAALAQGELRKHKVALRMELAVDVLPVLGDRVQLQQVILNLVMNGVEAMAAVADRRRELLICSRQHESDQVLVAVQDCGVGIDRQNLEKVFNAFYTTRAQGMGMGLAISRSIVENHGGRLWAVPNDGPGVTFQFTLLQYH